MTNGILACTIALGPLFILPAHAGRFGRTRAIARSHDVSSGDIADNWQEAYGIALDDGAVTRSTAAA